MAAENVGDSAADKRHVYKTAESLYKLGVAAVVNNYSTFKDEIRSLPASLLFDLYYKLYQDQTLCLLNLEFTDIDVFSTMLKVSNKRLQLLRSFQALMDHSRRITKDLTSAYIRKCNSVQLDPSSRENVIDLGLRLGNFLGDAGWYAESEKVLVTCRDICYMSDGSIYCIQKLLECCHKLLHTQAAFYNFDGAEQTFQLAYSLVQELRKTDNTTNLAGLFTEFSVLYFSRSEYAEAYRWSIDALHQAACGVPVHVIVDVLRQVAKSCVVKREFKKAGLLSRQSVYLAREVFGVKHPKYSDALSDYAFFLLNFDLVRPSVDVFTMALKIRQELFGENNLHVAIAHEDLAYALYVHEYSSGRFGLAREHANIAIQIMQNILPEDHLMLASVKRVKALVLEEIALDGLLSSSGMQELLAEAEELHLSALKLSLATFGEKNVQTAKHFGNLGRLYQSMKKFEEAETMHLKAIAIKEELLGEDDYEVGLSIGHLASLYNYHMKKYKKAEALYKRSIDISLKLFGESYSGLEYDYRGLVHVYHELKEVDKVADYTYLLNNWKLHRDITSQTEYEPIDTDGEVLSISDITAQFFQPN
ncbi:amyloid protein-binding protein 2 [Schistocerca nitens]|uniref:amyloid protein-binding protein 2 n=1 Tax=Schistocerca nitens TaxID=7011 RepID=UPI002117ED9D|nr:amyloid protein-binding protein 2 [Schistocerca nitens]